MEKLFKFINNNNDKENAFIYLLKFFYASTKDWIDGFLDIVFSVFLAYFFDSQNWTWFVLILILMVLIKIWYSVVNRYKIYKQNITNSSNQILKEVSAIMTTLDNYILSNGYDGVFEYASDLVCNSLYNMLPSFINSEVRVSIIQQFMEDNKKCCVMLSRVSQAKSKGNKSQKRVKYDNSKMGKEYYYLKILKDNIDSIIVLNKKEIQKSFCRKNNKLNKEILQYICIPSKINTNNIVFLLQIDAMDKVIVEKNEKEIKEFYENYIYPYICFLEHSYNISKMNSNIIGVEDNE